MDFGEIMNEAVRRQSDAIKRGETGQGAMVSYLDSVCNTLEASLRPVLTNPATPPRCAYKDGDEVIVVGESDA